MSYSSFLGLRAAPVFIGLLWATLLNGDPAPTYYYEQDFVSNPSLVASPAQVVVLTLAPVSQGKSALQEHAVRYGLDAGNYNFCLGGDASLTSLSVADGNGKVLLSVSPGNCTALTLVTAPYHVSIWHDPSKIKGKSRTLFVQLPRTHVTPLKADGTAKSGYWALQPDPGQDPTGAGRLGRINTLPKQNLNTSQGKPYYGMPVAADWTSTIFEDTALIRFDTGQILSGDTPLSLLPYLDAQTVNFGAVLGGYVDSTIPFLPGQFLIDDRQDGTVRFSATNTTSQPISLVDLAIPHWFFIGTDTFWSLPPFTEGTPSPSLLARLLFRSFPTTKGLTPAPLDEGEIGFFQSCSYGGNATVFSRDLSDLAALSAPFMDLPSVSSIRVGPNTQALLYPQPNFAGTPIVIQSDTDCGGSLPSSSAVGSFEILPLTRKFAAAGTCLACSLSGVSLSASVLDGSILSGTDLSSANLSGTSLQGATLDSVNLTHAVVSGAILDNANLKRTNWTGTDLRTAASFKTVTLDRALGFAGANLSGINLSGASLQNIDFNLSNLSNAKLAGANLSTAMISNAQISGADLTSAILHDVDASGALMSNTTLTGTDATGGYFLFAKLTGANLSSARFDHANLFAAYIDGANLAGTTFVGAELQPGVITGSQLRVAKLQGAILDNQIFDNQDFSGVDFSGASLQKTTFQWVTFGSTKFIGANLTGTTFNYFVPIDLSTVSFNNATLTGASFLGQVGGFRLGTATFVGATMNGVTFRSVDMTGADFTGAVMKGATFDNSSPRGAASFQGAVLDGALGLAGADLSLVPFTGVSLQNTNLSGTRFYGAELNNAILDGSNMSGVELTNNPAVRITEAASLNGAHLKNVNLSNAQMSGASFTNASFYGTVPAATTICNVPSNGFTTTCATAAGATMNNTQFGGAYLYGVDFRNTTVQGVQFGNSVLVGANFSGAQISTDPSVGTNSGFTSAFLQGTSFGTANLVNTTLSGAFLDFRAGGNDLYMELDGNHTKFPGWKNEGDKVCIFAFYTAATSVPAKNTTITCPDGAPAGTRGCGSGTSNNSRWNSGIDVSQTNPASSYLNPPSYGKAAPAICSVTASW